MNVLTRHCFTVFMASLLTVGCAHSTHIPPNNPPAVRPVGARLSTPTDLGTILEPFRAQNELPGLVALVLRGDQLHLGSCTKAMTATLVAMLVDEGKLKCSSKLAELFGGTVSNMDLNWKNVTLRQVLVHRAGLPRGDDPGVGLDPHLVAPNKSVRKLRQALVASQLSRKPETSPGTKEIYSNVGYIIVGAALEQLTGRAWEDLMQERLFKPLRISTGGFGAPGTAASVNQPWGHDRSGDPIEPGGPRSDLPRYAGPCGTAHMTFTDWRRFVAPHLRGDPANPNRRAAFLSEKAFEHLHRANPGETYAPGWAVGLFSPAKGERLDD